MPSFVPAWRYGGPTESVYQLCRHLALAGCEVRVLTTDADGRDRVLDVEKRREVEMAPGLRVRYCPRVISESVSPTMLGLLSKYAAWADIMHLTAVYSFPTFPVLVAGRLLGKPLVWSPHGSLQRWRRSRRRCLKEAWETVCRALMPSNTTLHLTSNAEKAASIGRMPRAHAGVIPNGVVIPASVRRVRDGATLRLGFIGRLHPIKGIENLLCACEHLEKDGSIAFTLAIAGAGHADYEQTLRKLVSELGLERRVKMLGVVRDEAKASFFEECNVVIVPSYMENFGMVVAEALAYAVPVIASRGTPWKDVERVGCGLWADNTPESLADAIARMNDLPLEEMGMRGRRWMSEEFSWPRVASQMVALYERSLSKPVKTAAESPASAA